MKAQSQFFSFRFSVNKKGVGTSQPIRNSRCTDGRLVARDHQSMVNQAFIPPLGRYLLPPRVLSILFLMLFSISSLATPEIDKDRDHGPQATKACPRYLTFDKFNPLVRLVGEYLSTIGFSVDDFPLLWELSGDISKAVWGGKDKRGEFNKQRILERIGPGNLHIGQDQNRRIYVQNDNAEWAARAIKGRFPQWLQSPQLIAVEIVDRAILLFDERRVLPLIIPQGSLIVMNGDFPVKIFYTLDQGIDYK